MTLEEAKAILSTHRIGELDPADALMREALELAASNAELAAWWENEQAFDRAYARKLASVTPPRELAALIMRGGATIFFARRLIADTTDEAVEEPAPAVREAIDKAVPTDKVISFLPEADIEPEKKVPGIGRWWWRLVPLSLAAVVVFGVLGIVMMMDSQKLVAQSNGELPAFAAHAASRVGANVPPLQEGAALDDVKDYLAANNAPVVEKLPARLGQVSLAGVSVDTWSTHRYTYFIIKSGGVKMHLFVLNYTEFPNDTVNEEPDSSVIKSFVVEIWRENGHVFVLLKPVPGE